MIFGIQGGRGSFNEQALIERLASNGSDIANHKVEYLYTSESVLEALSISQIDRGQFAVSNTIGGIVVETQKAKEVFNFTSKFEVESTYRLKITHSLMAYPGVSLEELTLVITHPQVIAQCRHNFSQRFPQLKLMEGEGDFVDPARVGAAIAKGELPRTTATASCSRIATIHGLEVVAIDLQDKVDNFTDFELVKRKEQ